MRNYGLKEITNEFVKFNEDIKDKVYEEYRNIFSEFKEIFKYCYTCDKYINGDKCYRIIIFPTQQDKDIYIRDYRHDCIHSFMDFYESKNEIYYEVRGNSCCRYYTEEKRVKTNEEVEEAIEKMSKTLIIKTLEYWHNLDTTDSYIIKD